VRQDRNILTRPLSARSLVASTLLGCHPPQLPARALVNMGLLYGVADGAIRVALSRMVSTGELEVCGNGDYRLTTRLAGRQARQEEGWRPLLRDWSGRWEMVVIVAGGRSAAARAELRAAMASLRMAELRDGVWLRPDNLDAQRLPSARAVVDAQCRRFEGRPAAGTDDKQLAEELWDLSDWANGARVLRREMKELLGRLEAGDDTALARGGLVSAAVLRHFVHDPLLPTALLASRWPGDAVRADYDRFEAALRARLREWERRHRRPRS
jgi:phenylacetic acid degradation operon negative regulatory protein